MHTGCGRLWEAVACIRITCFRVSGPLCLQFPAHCAVRRRSLFASHHGGGGHARHRPRYVHEARGSSCIARPFPRLAAPGYAARIPWDNYVSSSSARGYRGGAPVGTDAIFLDVGDVRVIKRFAGEDQAALTELLATDDDARLFPRALIKVLVNITDVRILQYALTLAYDFVSFDPAARARFFVKPGAEVRVLPCAHASGARPLHALPRHLPPTGRWYSPVALPSAHGRGGKRRTHL